MDGMKSTSGLDEPKNGKMSYFVNVKACAPVLFGGTDMTL